MYKKFSILITATEKVDDGYANVYNLIYRYYTNDGASHYSLMDVYDNEIYNWIYADDTNQYSDIVTFFSMIDADKFWTDNKLNIDGLADIIEDVESVKVISVDIDSWVVEDDLPQLRAQLGKKSDESVKNREEYTLDIIITISDPTDYKLDSRFAPYYRPVYQKPEDTGAAYFAIKLIDMGRDNITPDDSLVKFQSESALKEYLIVRNRELKSLIDEKIEYCKDEYYEERHDKSDRDKLNSSVDIRIVRNSAYTDQTFKNLILS